MAHARVVKNPKGYIDPYKVEVKSSQMGRLWTFHSWPKSKKSLGSKSQSMRMTENQISWYRANKRFSPYSKIVRI